MSRQPQVASSSSSSLSSPLPLSLQQQQQQQLPPPPPSSFTPLIPGKNMRIFMYRKFDVPEQAEVSMRESYGRIVNILYPIIGKTADVDQGAVSAASTAILDAVASSRSLEERESIACGLIFGFIAVPSRKVEQLFYTLLTTCISDWSSFAYTVLERVTDVGFYRIEPESRAKLMTVVMEMVRCASPYAEEACIRLMRCVPGGKPYASCDMGNLVLNALSMNKKWLLELPSIVAVSFYTFLRLIPEHNKPEFKQTFDREIGYCLYLWKERPSFCLKIGRDVLRALQDVGHIKVFHDILVEISRSASFKELGSTPTTQQILTARITPEMERDIAFLLSNVTYAQQKYYQGWLYSKYFMGDCEYIAPDVVRYICCICNPPEENKARDIFDRWAFVGWLYSLMRTDGGKGLVKQAVFYDWFWFNPEADNVAFLEPAAGVMFYSLAQYREMTATFLEFLVISSEVYCAKEKAFITGNIKKSIKALIAARKFQSFQQLFDFDGVHKAVHDKFIAFDSAADTPQDKLVPHQQTPKQQAETVGPKEQKQIGKAKIQLPGDVQKMQMQVPRQPNLLQSKNNTDANANQIHAQRESERDQKVPSVGKVSELFITDPTFDNFLCAIRLYTGKPRDHDATFLKIVEVFSEVIGGDIIDCTLNSIFMRNRGVLPTLFETALGDPDHERRQVLFEVMAHLRKHHHPSIGYRFFAYAACRNNKDFSRSPRSYVNRHFMGSLKAFICSLVESPDTRIDPYMEFVDIAREDGKDTPNSAIANDFVVCAKECPPAYALLVPLVLKHIDIDAKMSTEILATSAQFLLPDQIDGLISYIEKGEINIVPQATSIEEALSLVSGEDLDPYEKANALRLIFADYSHRGALAKFIQDTLENGSGSADRSMLFSLPVSVETVRDVLASFPTPDAQEILDALFKWNKGKFADCLLSLLENPEFKEQAMGKISEMDASLAWISSDEKLKDFIEKESKEEPFNPCLDKLMKSIRAHTENDDENDNDDEPKAKTMKFNV